MRFIVAIPWLVMVSALVFAEAQNYYCPDRCNPTCVSYYILESEKCGANYIYFRVGNGYAICRCPEVK